MAEVTTAKDIREDQLAHELGNVALEAVEHPNGETTLRTSAVSQGTLVDAVAAHVANPLWVDPDPPPVDPFPPASGGGPPSWGSVTDKPATFPPDPHNHDDRYYTEGEADSLLAGKASSSHDHNNLYYTETEVDSALAGKASTGHTHAQLHNQQHAVTSTSDHTFPGGTANFLRADGTWSAPPAGGSGPTESAIVLGSDHPNSTVTPGAVTGLNAALVAGTYLVKYWLVYRTAATTTGIQLYLDYSGTSSRLAGTWYQLTTGGSAATGVGDQATTLTAQMLEGKGQRADGATTGPTQGVDTANADEFAVYEALIVPTGAGTLSLMMNSETAAVAATIMAGSTLALTKVA